MFQKAQRVKAKLKLALAGPSGSGKTLSAIRLARGLVGKEGKIAVIDTENGSASLYADKLEKDWGIPSAFDVSSISPPFTTEKYITLIHGAVKAGYDVLVIDQITHAWAGPGGLLEQKEHLDARPGANHWANWAPITKKQEAFKASFLHADIHVIVTMRSKQDYVQTENNGKKKIEKMGMAPQQREGMEYEFTTVFDIAMNHEASVSKDRTNLFDGKFFMITEETGEEFRTWMESGKDAPPPPKIEPKPTITPRPQGASAPAKIIPKNQAPADIFPPIQNANIDHPGDYKLSIKDTRYYGKTISELHGANAAAFIKMYEWLLPNARTETQKLDAEAITTYFDYADGPPPDADMSEQAADPVEVPQFDSDEPLPF